MEVGPASSRGSRRRVVAPVAWALVLPAAVLQAVVLTVGSVGYGYHRDELYFRMLPPAWGYVDQPPLVPFLARTMAGSVADEAWALRIPATVATALSVLLVALLARELGATRGGQGLAAWGYAFAALPLMLGHVLLTSTLDQLFWLLVVLVVVRAVLGRERWWVVAGAAAGAATYSRLLIAVLAGGLVLGLAALGPRRVFRSPWLWAGAVVGAALALPNLLYQATHGWPQLAMGAALSENNAAEVRSLLVPLLVLMLGPVVAAVWVTGTVWLLRRPQRDRFGYLVVAFAVLVAFTAYSGAQPHYPVHLLAVMYAAGCVPVARWLADRAGWRRAAAAGVVVNSVFSVVLALPVVPVSALGGTPLPDIGPLVPDQVGWPRYVAQVAEVYRSAQGRGPVAVITSNYGEAGAIARYGPAHGLPRPFSGQNALYEAGRPAAGTGTVVVVGGQVPWVTSLFARCDVRARLDNGVGVDNEEQGLPIAVCREPVATWEVLWPRFRHLD